MPINLSEQEKFLETRLKKWKNEIKIEKYGLTINTEIENLDLSILKFFKHRYTQKNIRSK